MTGRGRSRSQRIEDFWNDYPDCITLLSESEFNSKLKKLTSEGLEDVENLTKKSYELYKFAMRDSAYEAVDIAKKMHKEILQRFEDYTSKDKLFNYVESVYWAANNVHGRLLIARNREHFDNFSIRKIELVECLLKGSMSEDDAKELENEILDDESLLFGDPHLELIKGAYHEVLSFLLYKQLFSIVDNLLNLGESTQTISSLLSRESYFGNNKPEDFIEKNAHFILQKRYNGKLDTSIRQVGHFARAFTGLPLEVQIESYSGPAHFDGKTIQLPTPPASYSFTEASRLFLVSTAHQAGQIEFGTFNLDAGILKEVESQLTNYYGDTKQ
tara:strand:- start:136 stop:1122 length:987 start_codon:yes stop_codon:yes gene_type:complete